MFNSVPIKLFIFNLKKIKKKGDSVFLMTQVLFLTVLDKTSVLTELEKWKMSYSHVQHCWCICVTLVSGHTAPWLLQLSFSTAAYHEDTYWFVWGHLEKHVTFFIMHVRGLPFILKTRKDKNKKPDPKTQKSKLTRNQKWILFSPVEG